MALTLSRAERPRFERIRELLDALDSYTDLRAAVLLGLSDDKTPNDAFKTLKGKPISASARTEQIFRYAAPRMGVRDGKKIDREQRDYVFPALRELGLIEKSYVLSSKAAAKAGKPIEIGTHVPKSASNAYVLTPDARKLLVDTIDKSWTSRLAAFVSDTPERRLRALQRESSAAAVGTAHSALIAAATRALRTSLLTGYELVYVDDADGDRIRDEWKAKLEPLGLMPSIETPFPDAILVNEATREVWFVDAVVSDGEIDETRAGELRKFAGDARFTVAGFTTAYETWQRAAGRQALMKNLAVGSTLWIAEDGGKLYDVHALVK